MVVQLVQTTKKYRIAFQELGLLPAYSYEPQPILDCDRSRFICARTRPYGLTPFKGQQNSAVQVIPFVLRVLAIEE